MKIAGVSSSRQSFPGLGAVRMPITALPADQSTGLHSTIQITEESS